MSYCTGGSFCFDCSDDGVSGYCWCCVGCKWDHTTDTGLCSGNRAVGLGSDSDSSRRCRNCGRREALYHRSSGNFPKGYIGWEWDDDDDDFLHRHDGADRRDFGTDAVESYSGVREVELEMAVGNVTVERHDGDTIEVETVGVAEELKFHSYMEENTLKLEAKKRVTGIEGAEDGTVYLRIPRDLSLDEVSLMVGVGELQVEDISTRDLSVEVGVGNGVVHNFQAAEASLECGTGTLEATGSVTQELDMENDVGNIIYHAAGNRKEYNYEISCGAGEIVIGEEVYYGIKPEEKINNNVQKLINIECNVGDITVDFTGA